MGYIIVEQATVAGARDYGAFERVGGNQWALQWVRVGYLERAHHSYAYSPGVWLFTTDVDAHAVTVRFELHGALYEVSAIPSNCRAPEERGILRASPGPVRLLAQT